MYNKLLFLFAISYALLGAQQINNRQQEYSQRTDNIPSEQALNKINKNCFIQNKGQWNSEVKYLACIGGMNVWITNSGVVYDYYKIKRKNADTKMLKMNPREQRDYENKNTTIEGNVVKMLLVNAEKEVTSAGSEQREGYYNYFIGNDKSKWTSFVPLYDNVELQGVYKNIDVKYYYDNGMLRYDYKAQTGADISQIKFKFEGQEGISINANGDLVLKTSIGEVTNGKNYAYQMDGGRKQEVECKFERREDGIIGLKVENYDVKKELIIDPLVYSTFIGGNKYDQGNSIALDRSGNAYITGFSYSPDFPTTTGAYQTTLNSSNIQNAFVTKLDPTGSALVYSTFIGGSGGDAGNSIAIDAGGNAYITGLTISSNYPITIGAYQTTPGGATDAFVAKLNSTGSDLIYSTYLGGSGVDKGNSISIDGNGNAYITGGTTSQNFPATSSAYQTTYGGTGNAFVTKLNAAGSGLIYSTYIGGNSGDEGSAIAIDVNGNAYITGSTGNGYPTTSGAYQTTYNGSLGIAFVTKLNSTGSGLIYSTYIGGNGGDWGSSIAIDDKGNAYLTGQTTSSDFPTTSGAYQITFGGDAADAFVTKLNSTGSALNYSTYIGGSGSDIGNSIAIDAGGNAYIVGGTYSSNYPTTSDAYQTTLNINLMSNSGANVFLTKLDPTGSTLTYSTYVGGSTGDFGNSIAIDTSGNAYITGTALSSDYPITSGAYQTTFGGGEDAFVTKLNINHGIYPIVSTRSATNVSLNSSTLNGAVNANGSGTVVQFDYGTTTSYGNTVTAVQSPVTGDAAINDSANITGLTTSTLYHFRVKATNNGVTSYGADFTFTTLHIISNEVQLISPQNGSLGNVQPVQLVWSSFFGASNYHFQVSTDSTFATTILDTTITDTTCPAHIPNTPTKNYGLNNLTKYYWRVSAISTGGASVWSQVWNFTTLGNPSQAILLYPAANSVNIPVTINFKWNQSQDQLAIAKLKGNIKNAKTISNAGTSGKMSIANVSQYWFELMTDTASANYVENNNTLTDTTTLVSGLQNSTNYWWRVSAMNEADWGAFTGWSKFTTIIDTPGVVILLSPNSNTTMPNEYSAILFTWESASFSSTYELQIALNTNFNPVFFDTIGVADTIFNYHIFGGIPAFSWRVRGSNIAGTGSWSSAMTVTKFLDLINEKNGLPLTYEMYQNFPNPFNPSTMINYALPFSSNVRIEIYNVLGQKIRELLNEQKNAGYYSVNFNTTGLASGIYFYFIDAKSNDGKSEFRNTKKMVLLR